jgi:hypothetical protein
MRSPPSCTNGAPSRRAHSRSRSRHKPSWQPARDDVFPEPAENTLHMAPFSPRRCWTGPSRQASPRSDSAQIDSAAACPRYSRTERRGRNTHPLEQWGNLSEQMGTIGSDRTTETGNLDVSGRSDTAKPAEALYHLQCPSRRAHPIRPTGVSPWHHGNIAPRRIFFAAPESCFLVEPESCSRSGLAPADRPWRNPAPAC